MSEERPPMKTIAFVSISSLLGGLIGAHYAIDGTYYSILAFIVAAIVSMFSSLLIIMAVWLLRGAP